LQIARRKISVVVETGYIQTQIMFTLLRLLVPGLGSKEAIVKVYIHLHVIVLVWYCLLFGLVIPKPCTRNLNSGSRD
jgi:hypothetical protein